VKKAVILHGTQGSPEGNWFRWLEGELSSRGLKVWLPALPSAEQPSLRRWAEFVSHNVPFDLDDETVIIGHSSGAILSLILTQEAATKLGGVVAISVFHDNSLGWDANNKLFDVELDYEKIKSNAGSLLFVHSDNDPYVPLEQAKYVADNCQAEIIVVPGQGHFNLEASEAYTQFQLLLDLLNKRQLI
jgi:predicted alpha/beta hydrolase family esterase